MTMMINPSVTQPFISFLPVMPLHSTQDKLDNDEPPVLDLCVRKRPNSPTNPHNYTPIKYAAIPVGPLRSDSPKSHSTSSESSEISSSENKDINGNCPAMRVPPRRPFKAYTKDPFSLNFIGLSTDIFNKDSSEAYAEFRQRVMPIVHTGHNGTNKNMRRNQNQNRQQTASPTYWEKRKKNNEAAKRSRDARRAKEDEIAIRCAFLEHENIQLRMKLDALECENERLRNIPYHRIMNV